MIKRAYKNLGRNQMLWDNGFPSRLMDNATAVNNKIKDIENNFNLVLIAERSKKILYNLRFYFRYWKTLNN